MGDESNFANQNSRNNRSAESSSAPIASRAGNQIDLAPLKEVETLAIKADMHRSDSKTKGNVED